MLDTGYQTKIQVIKLAKSEQWYVHFPGAVAQAIEFQRGETVEWVIDDHQRLVLQRSDESVRTLKKTPEKNLIGNFKILFGQCTSAFNRSRTYERARNLALGLLSCMGRCTITRMLNASGHQFKDWSASYRLFKEERMKMDELFNSIRKQVIHLNEPQESIYAHMDDTLLRKRGKKSMERVGWVIPLVPLFRVTSYGDNVLFKFHYPY